MGTIEISGMTSREIISCDLTWKFKHDAVVTMCDVASSLLTTTFDTHDDDNDRP